MENDIYIEEIFQSTSSSIITYSQEIIKANEIDSIATEEDEMLLFKHSDLISNFAKDNLTYVDILFIFSEYFNTFYTHQYFFVRKQRFEDAELLKQAMEIEVNFAIEFMIHKTKAKSLTSDVKKLEEKYLQYYLL